MILDHMIRSAYSSGLKNMGVGAGIGAATGAVTSDDGVISGAFSGAVFGAGLGAANKMIATSYLNKVAAQVDLVQNGTNTNGFGLGLNIFTKPENKNLGFEFMSDNSNILNGRTLAEESETIRQHAKAPKAAPVTTP